MKNQKNKDLFLCHIDGEYTKYLKEFDPHVQHNYDNNRNKKPYVGIVLNINGKNYFAPLTSPKEKHLKLRDSDPTTFKIKHNNEFIGSVLLNNMIPVKLEHVSRIEISQVKDRVYRKLLTKDYQILTNNRDNIINKANVLYDNVIQNRSPYFTKVSCDFKKLERACDNYLSKGKLYQIDFSFNKSETERVKYYSYNVLVNGVRADEALNE